MKCRLKKNTRIIINLFIYDVKKKQILNYGTKARMIPLMYSLLGTMLFNLKSEVNKLALVQ